MRRRLRAVLIITAMLAVPLHADYQAGLDAFTEGHYKRAMQEWKAVVGQPPTAVNPAIYVETHYAIAKLYWEGLGVTRDYYAAHEWLVKAADLGHAGAMSKLGFLYTDGIVVQQDFGQAFDWYQRAARLGDVDAQYNLGIFYLNGWGTERDPTMARQYLAAASAQGDQAAEQALQQLMASDAAAAPAVVVAPEPPAPEQEAPGESPLRPAGWILEQDPDHYTIQVIGLRDRQKLEELLDGHDDLAPFAIYVTQARSNPIFVLVQGVYPTVEEARAARDVFPRRINRPDRTWIRRFGKVQEVIRKEQGR